MNIFFTSDTHFGHTNVIKYCERPFSSVDEMDSELIRRWNSVVGKSDLVYHLGDFSFTGTTRLKEILPQLNGGIVLIRGNHDKKMFKKHSNELRIDGFLESKLSYKMKLSNGQSIMLSHYPYKDSYQDYRDFSPEQLVNEGLPLLHGHVHRTWKTQGKMINVGVDVWNFTPISEQEIIKCIEEIHAIRD